MYIYIHTHTLKYLVKFQSEQTVNIPASIQQPHRHKRCPQKSAMALGHPPKSSEPLPKRTQRKKDLYNSLENWQ